MSRLQHWAPYAPDGRTPWSLQRVVHLHRRVGFAATWEELQRDLKDGPAASVERLLAGKACAAPADFDEAANLLADAAVTAGDVGRLRAWWIYRMLLGPDPLGEKLTLLWHDHFATANSKVQDVALMRRQNDTLRRYARGRFADLLNAAVREPALLIYLDAPQNRKGHANENLARELMELFTLGVGHYSEADVKEAARALTGWMVEEGRLVLAPARHDSGQKTILGQSGRWNGNDLVRILLDQPATAERVVSRLGQLFFGEKALPAAAARELAKGLREHDLDIGWAIGVILKSQHFFAEANLQTRILGPVELVVGAARALEMIEPPPSTLALADWAARIGQDLFEPPNVGGWPGGRAWIHTRSLIARENYALALVQGIDVGRSVHYDAAAQAKKHGFGSAADDVLTFHHRLLFGTDPGSELRRRVAGTTGGKMVALLLAAPEAQLG